MPYYKAVEFAVWCDGCTNIIDFGYTEARTIRKAARAWRKAGWRPGGKGNGRDMWFCPECVAKGKHKQVT